MGIGEILMVALVALLVIPPKQLPSVMNRLGSCYASFRRFLGRFAPYS